MSDNIYEPPQAPCADAEEIQRPLRRFSVAILLSYIGLGVTAATTAGALVTVLFYVRSGVITSMGAGMPLLLQGCFCVLLVATLIGLRQRYQWARIVMLVLLALCLSFSVRLAIHNGLHPEPIPGPYIPANEGERDGARFATLIIPYVMGAIELSMLWAFLFRPGVKGQFVR